MNRLRWPAAEHDVRVYTDTLTLYAYASGNGLAALKPIF